MDKVKDMPTSFNDKAVEIVMDNKLGYERVAMACAASFAKMMGFSDERIEDLKTVVAEAAINAIQHGNKERPDAKVAMSMNLKDGALHIAVAMRSYEVGELLIANGADVNAQSGVGETPLISASNSAPTSRTEGMRSSQFLVSIR